MFNPVAPNFNIRVDLPNIKSNVGGANSNVSGGNNCNGKPGGHTAKTAKKCNLRKVTAAQHNKLHPEKGRKAAAARKRKTTKRKTTRKKTKTRRKK